MVKSVCPWEPGGPESQRREVRAGGCPLAPTLMPALVQAAAPGPVPSQPHHSPVFPSSTLSRSATLNEFGWTMWESAEPGQAGIYHWANKEPECEQEW